MDILTNTGTLFSSLFLFCSVLFFFPPRIIAESDESFIYLWMYSAISHVVGVIISFSEASFRDIVVLDPGTINE
jgi:hypothetical protein